MNRIRGLGFRGEGSKLLEYGFRVLVRGKVFGFMVSWFGLRSSG